MILHTLTNIIACFFGIIYHIGYQTIVIWRMMSAKLWRHQILASVTRGTGTFVSKYPPEFQCSDGVFLYAIKRALFSGGLFVLEVGDAGLDEDVVPGDELLDVAVLYALLVPLGENF